MKSKTHTLESILINGVMVGEDGPGEQLYVYKSGGWFWSVMIEAETERSDAMLGQIRLASMEEITKGFSPAAIEEELSL